jgi:hypothetical protein
VRYILCDRAIVCIVCVLYQVLEHDDYLLKVKTCRIKRCKLRCVDCLYNNKNNYYSLFYHVLSFIL